MLPQTIQTARLLLRIPAPADAGTIFDTYGQDPAVSKYMVWRPLTRVAEAEQFIDEAIAGWGRISFQRIKIFSLCGSF